MIRDIPGVDRGDLSCWAIANMYKAMKEAERAALSYVLAKRRLGSAGTTMMDLEQFANDNKWYMQQAQMYSSIFLAAEMADDSPRQAQYQAAIRAVDAERAGKTIPQQRTS